MAKTNFSKVEESLRVGMDNMHIQQLGKQADIAQGVTRPELKGLMEKAAKVAAKTALERKAILHVIKQSAKEFDTPSFYAFIGCEPKDIAAMLAQPKELKRDDWEKLKQIKEKALAFRRNSAAAHPEQGDENLIEMQRKRHLNKRFNIKEKWLPMK